MNIFFCFSASNFFLSFKIRRSKIWLLWFNGIENKRSRCSYCKTSINDRYGKQYSLATLVDEFCVSLGSIAKGGPGGGGLPPLAWSGAPWNKLAKHDTYREWRLIAPLTLHSSYGPSLSLSQFKKPHLLNLKVFIDIRFSRRIAVLHSK